MTNTKESTLSTIKALLNKILARLHESYVHGKNISESIEKQCQDRFGKSWDETRAQMMKAVSSIEFAPGRMLDPDGAVKGIGLAGGTGNWMTNLYLGVLYLHFIRAPRCHGVSINAVSGKPVEVQRISLSGMIGDMIFNEVVKAIESGQQTEFLNETDPLYWKLLHIASRVLPDEVERVLASHGL